MTCVAERSARAALLLALLIALSETGALGQVLGTEFQVNSFTLEDQDDAAVAADSSGRALVVWASAMQDGSGSAVVARRIDPSGSPSGGEIQVNQYTTGAQSNPAVAADGQGGFVVAWESSGQDGSWLGVYARRFEANGVPAGGEILVNTETAGDQNQPAVAMFGSGEFLIVWTHHTGGPVAETDVMARRFDATGIPYGIEFRINAFTTGSQWRPRVAASEGSEFVVVWESDGQDGSASGVFGRRFDATGVPLSGDFRVNTYTTSLQEYPDVTSTHDGGFVVVWSSRDQELPGEGGDEVYLQRYDSSGDPLGPEVRVNSETEDHQSFPAVSSDPAGTFVVAWRSRNQDGSGSGVFGQHFDSNGDPSGPEFRINAYTHFSQSFPAVAALGSGEFAVGWQSDGQEGPGYAAYGVFGRRVRFPSFVDGFETGNVCAWSASTGGGPCP